MQQNHPTHLAKAAVSLLTSTAGISFMLFLLMSSTNAVTAQRALEDLMTALRPRVTTLVAAWCAGQTVQPLHQTSVVDEVLAYLRDAITQCRSRSPLDFSTWVERRVMEWLDSDGETPRAKVARARGQGFTQSPAVDGPLLSTAPKTERAAVIYATMLRLTVAERRVLDLRQQRRATWKTVARSLGVSVSMAMSRHAKAINRAQMVALDVLAERTAEPPDQFVGAVDADGMFHAA